jgi:uncharacterized RDD family membrane protein YckC
MAATDPYQPPKAELTDHEDPAEAQLATRGQRFGAAIVDTIIGFVFAVPLMMSLGLWDYAKRGRPVPFSLTLLSMALGFGFFVLVHGYFLKRNGQTVGKKLVGIRIADLQGELPAFGRLIGLRYLPISLVTLIPAIGQLLPLVDVLFIFRSDRRCVHDLIAGTKVVKAA